MRYKSNPDTGELVKDFYPRFADESSFLSLPPGTPIPFFKINQGQGPIFMIFDMKALSYGNKELDIG